MDERRPLAERMRPQKLEDVLGQDDIIGEGKILTEIVKKQEPVNIIFWGPPGTGKTTLARIIAKEFKADFIEISAVTSGKKDVEKVVERAKQNWNLKTRTVLFVDEIHRFNKAQQDAFLPHVESGLITLIGATTENPYFEVNGALLSRSMIFELYPLGTDDIMELIRRAVEDPERGMGAYDAEIGEEAARFLAEMSGGDARRALNAVELGIMTTERSGDGLIHLTMDVVRECIQKRTARYDKSGDNHFDTISAFIKSMRGSDPDAAVYYLARMLEAGEDPVFIARRIVSCASEDVGNADPNAIVVAVNCSMACERIGMPESQIILSQAAEYVATAPKSNTAVESIMAARKSVQETGSLPIPGYLQDAHHKGAQGLGRGIGYQYAHVYEDHYAGQPMLPEQLRGERFYVPSDNGYEKKIREHMASLTNDKRYTDPEHLLPRPDHEE